jgi:hypothetical protein
VCLKENIGKCLQLLEDVSWANTRARSCFLKIPFLRPVERRMLGDKIRNLKGGTDHNGLWKSLRVVRSGEKKSL